MERGQLLTTLSFHYIIHIIILNYNSFKFTGEKNMSIIRTRFEIETFVLGAHPTTARKAQALLVDLTEARATNHPDLEVLEAVAADFEAANGKLEELVAGIESSEEEYWVEKLAKLAAIDILTIGKVQPEHMAYMSSLNDAAFSACVKTATVLAKTLNEQVREIEAELGSDLASV
jgi:hypothetical protein